MVDLLGRLLLVERKDAIRYGFDPAVSLATTDTEDAPESQGADVLPNPVSLSPVSVIWQLAKSPRALAALLTTLIWGCAPLCSDWDPFNRS
jgi:hypothetical protein